MSQKQNRKPTWSHPWGYVESFFVAFGLIIVGFAMEFSTQGRGVPDFTNATLNVTAAVLVLLILTGGLFFRKIPLIQWLSGVPAAISAIAGISFMALLMGLTLQQQNTDAFWVSRLGLSRVTSSWPYLLTTFYLLIVLGMATIKRIYPWNSGNIGYLLNHLGLWIVIFAATFGASQIHRLEMTLQEGRLEHRALDRKYNVWIDMPFAIRLNDFVLEQYPPRLGIIDNKTGRIIHENGKNLMLVDTAATASMLDWHIQVLTYFDQSGKAGEHYYFNNEPGAAPSVQVQAINKKFSDTITGWISCGSFNRPYEALKISDQYSLIMLFPEPKRFLSEIEILTTETETISVSLEVNNPFSFQGWKIYQLSYDDELGRWSDTSVIELVRDPWLPAVYSGIFMMMAGAVSLFWRGNKNRITP